MRVLLRGNESASSCNAGLGSENALQGGGASAPEPQAEASIGVQDCAGGAAAHSADCDVPEELEAILGELRHCLNRLYGPFMCCPWLCRLQAAALYRTDASYRTLQRSVDSHRKRCKHWSHRVMTSPLRGMRGQCRHAPGRTW